jgi:hypothetical protein
MTIQSRMNKEYTTPAKAGLAPSEWAANLSNKNPEERNKTQKPDGSYLTTRLTCKCSETSLSSRMTVSSTHSKRIPNLKYLDPTTTVKTWVILKITKYRFRFSLKI